MPTPDDFTGAPDAPDTAETLEATTANAPTHLPRLTRVPGGLPDMDAPIVRAAVAGESVRLRVPVQLYDPSDRSYRNLEGVSSVMELGDAPSAAKFREDLDAWMRAWAEAGRA